MLLSIYPVNDMKFFIIKIHTHECKIKKKKKKEHPLFYPAILSGPLQVSYRKNKGKRDKREKKKIK